MITWLEPSPALREFVRWYVYINRAETAQHPVIPVLETRLAFYPRSACRVFDHRLQGIDTVARAAVIGPQTRRWVDLPPGGVDVFFAFFQPGGFHRLFGGDSSALDQHADDCGAQLGHAGAGARRGRDDVRKCGRAFGDRLSDLADTGGQHRCGHLVGLGAWCWLGHVRQRADL